MKVKLLIIICLSFVLVVGLNATKKEFNNHKVLLGFNINWSFLPPLNEDIVSVITQLKPDIIRYPGGTVSKTWRWEKGYTTKRPNKTKHTLDELYMLKSKTNSDVIFVLNTISSSLENQLKLLNTAKTMGIEIKYIEIGNEHYLGKGINKDDLGKHQDNVVAFPTGKEYALFANKWSSAIKKEFPNVKVGITMLGRISKHNKRLKTWNKLIVENIDYKLFDAFVYHIYVHAKKDTDLDEKKMNQIIKNRINIFEKSMVDKRDKEIWITEYGVHAIKEKDAVKMTQKLADYIESIADIALPQVLYTKSKTKHFSLLAPNGAKSLTPLGKMFSTRKVHY